MSKCRHCGDEGHNVRTCPLIDVEKGPWFMDPDERWHTKVVFEEGECPGAPGEEREEPCNCDLFYEGETHIDFSDVD